MLSAVRKAKSESRRKLRAPVTVLSVCDTPERIASLRGAAADLRAAANAQTLVLCEGRALEVQLRFS